MKKILFLLCIATVSYAQEKKKSTLDELMPKSYTVQEVSSLNSKSYNVTNNKTLETKRYDVNKTFEIYNVNETTLYKKKEDKKSIYDDINWTNKKKEDERD